MIRQNLIKFVIGAILSFFACDSNAPLVNVKNNPSPTEQTTYWVVIMFNPIGTQFISEVFPLPVDDNQSVAIAARGWGNLKFVTDEKSVYKFNNREEAEKFRREKGGVDLKITADELKKYLCLGQILPPPKDFWVIIGENYEGDNFISEILHLPEFERKIIESAVKNWGNTDGTVLFRIEESNLHKFANQTEAEKFRVEKQLPDLKLNGKTLQKYLCVEQVRILEANKTPSPKSKTH